MDPSKKRKVDENGGIVTVESYGKQVSLSPQEARKIMERFSQEQLLDLLQQAVLRHPDVLDAVRSIADPDTTQRKLFVRGLGWETTSDNLRSLFSSYGDLEEAVVILDKTTGKSKGYGFVIFKHVDGALLALREPSKKIDGRVTVTQLAAAGNSHSNPNPTAVDVTLRKIYVANVPYDMPAEKLLGHFAQYGEIEEGPLGFDKQTGKSRGFALFVYKTAEGANAALLEPVKTIEGRQLNCKLAIDGKKKPGGPGQVAANGAQPQPPQGGDGMGLGMGMLHQPPYGAPSGYAAAGYSAALQGPTGAHHHPPLGGPGLAAPVQPTGYNTAAAAAVGGPYGGYGGPGPTGYAGTGAGAATAGLGGGAAVAIAPSSYRLQPTSAGMPSGAYPEPGHYSLSSSAPSFPNQHQGTSPAPRVPTSGTYPNLPPYY
ncbi:hypothetical protein Tsubulata_009142 [Turnera subulata]|uniref:RRM domain-containing protein n=1 Tax=Turnera subulata TaxID=218843 RepID=A0A9Q0JMJ7_9ROSI|nr:hypothetical protein Tsubulata_009142 [Turnera subulata]